MSREAVRELQERRASHVTALETIDAALRLLGAATPGRRARRPATKAESSVSNARSEAAKRMWAKRRAAELQPKAKTKVQRQRNNEHPVQAVSRPASLAAAATE